MNQAQVIERLRKEAEINKTANAVFHVFGLRDRARNIVTLSALSQRMRNEGFTFDDLEYVKVLRFLANLGLGQLDLDSKGRVRALKDIRISLVSIGKVACNKESKLDGFIPRNRYQTFVEQETSIRPPVFQTKKPAPKAAIAPIGLTMEVNGKVVTIQIPKDFTAEDIAGLVSKF